MNKTNWISFTVLLCCLTGYATAGSRDENVVLVPLRATSANTGHIAQAALTPNGNGHTGISLFIGGVPETVTVPVHLYTYIYPGTCAALGERPAYEMNQTVIQNGNLGSGVPAFEKRVAVPLEQLRAGGYALVVRTAPADGFVNIFCGDIRSA
ncbi:hypothetical protein [Cupriavidus pinatubonensis]|uniref:Uncharacterized protein n=1 Tax=Cupriavidus pinatubonensis TaxID=248026 RepID=A0ABM8WFK2_9BURK|nr:hypothetical protein [Cupriavidus pinatubonensis]CAG9166133.1 hypothetical protein LMG23994_00908 [Cupriavidus pinatubonensis]